MYALIEFAGKQYQVEEGSSIKVPRVQGEVGTKVTFDKILYIDNGKNKKIGNPYIKSVSFSGKIDSHGKENKIIVFKKKRRKGYQKKNGYTHKFTLVTINKFLTKTTSSTKKISTAKKKTSPIKKTTANKKK